MPIVNESDEDESTEQDVIFFDSRQQAAKLLRKMIAPVKNKDFFKYDSIFFLLVVEFYISTVLYKF